MRYQTSFLALFIVASVLVGAGCAPSFPASVSVDTSNWKTYENSLCSISFKYPKDAALVSASERSVTISTLEDAETQNIQEGEMPSAYYVHMECKALQNVVAENGNSFSTDSGSIANLVDFFRANTNTSIQKIGDVAVGGHPAIAAHIGASQWYSVWIDRGNVTIIDFSYAQDASELSPAQRAILESVVLTK